MAEFLIDELKGDILAVLQRYKDHLIQEGKAAFFAPDRLWNTLTTKQKQIWNIWQKENSGRTDFVVKLKERVRAAKITEKRDDGTD